jgi:hypothetical protein
MGFRNGQEKKVFELWLRLILQWDIQCYPLCESEEGKGQGCEVREGQDEERKTLEPPQGGDVPKMRKKQHQLLYCLIFDRFFWSQIFSQIFVLFRASAALAVRQCWDRKKKVCAPRIDDGQVQSPEHTACRLERHAVGEGDVSKIDRLEQQTNARQITAKRGTEGRARPAQTARRSSSSESRA